jgi:hypothetical protein
MDVVMSHRLCASFEYGVAVEVLVVFYRVAVLDDAFGAAVGRWGTTRLVSYFPQPGLPQVRTRLK